MPHNLIDAFKSTLAELQYADLLIEVIDAADPNWESHIGIVQDILKDLDLQNKEVLYVFNKIDKIEDDPLLLQAFNNYQPHVLTSTISKEGLEQLKESIKAWIQLNRTKA